LDFDVLTDLSKDSTLAKKPITNIAALKKKLKHLAMKQVNEIAFWSRYNALFGDSDLKLREIRGKSYAEVAKLVAKRIVVIKTRLSATAGKSWESDFVKECQVKEDELKRTWEEEWPKLCDGKQLIRDLHEEIGFTEGLERLKVRIINGMAAGKTELWEDVENKLQILMKEPAK
jgi:hypothetical protein